MTAVGNFSVKAALGTFMGTISHLLQFIWKFVLVSQEFCVLPAASIIHLADRCCLFNILL